MSFNLTINDLENILKNTNGFIAGGFALYCYLNNKIDLSIDLPEDSDIDIFIKLPLNYEQIRKNIELGSIYVPFEYLAIQYVDSILLNKGYKKNCKYDDINKRMKQSNNFSNLDEIEYHKCALSHFIKNITTYHNEEYNKKIQIIIIYDCLIEEFLKTFDINICQIAIYWDYKNNKFNFYHNSIKYLTYYELQLIKKKHMFICNPLYYANLENRILKYINRGFTLINFKGDFIFCHQNITINDINQYIISNYEPKVITWETFNNKNKNYYSNNINELINNMIQGYLPI